MELRLKRLLLGVVIWWLYQPPDDSDLFTDVHFESALEMATAESSKSLMVIGDFNCDLSSLSITESNAILHDVMT